MKKKRYTLLKEVHRDKTEIDGKFYLNCCKGIFLALAEQNVLSREEYERCVKSAEKKLL